MSKLLQAIWPRPEFLAAADIAALLQEGKALDDRIKDLKGLGDAETLPYLDAAKRITEEEDRRKIGAENRATTFIAAVAALIPLMTWAISTATPSSTCAPGWGCFVWTGVFGLAVVFFVTAAYWALKTLAVANYHVIGVEDLVQAKEKRQNIHKVLVQQTLLQARRNRDTINLKLSFIKVAQRRFFNGLVVLGFLLVLDPASRFGLLDVIGNYLASWDARSKETPSGISPVPPKPEPLHESSLSTISLPAEQVPAKPPKRP
jgi:hypothetical protein